MTWTGSRLGVVGKLALAEVVVPGELFAERRKRLLALLSEACLFVRKRQRQFKPAMFNDFQVAWASVRGLLLGSRHCPKAVVAKPDVSSWWLRIQDGWAFTDLASRIVPAQGRMAKCPKSHAVSTDPRL